MYVISKIEVPSDEFCDGVREGYVYEVTSSDSRGVIVQDYYDRGLYLYEGEYIPIEGYTEDTREGARLMVKPLWDLDKDVTRGCVYSVEGWVEHPDGVCPRVCGDRGYYRVLYDGEYTIVGLNYTIVVGENDGSAITGEQECVSDHELFLIPGNFLMVTEGDIKTYIKVKGYDNGVLWYDDWVDSVYWGDHENSGRTLRITNQEFRVPTEEDMKWKSLVEIMIGTGESISINAAKKIADKMMEYLV